MNVNRTTKLLAALAITFVATVGCSKDAEKGGGGAAGGAAKSAFAIFPQDANLLAGINVGQVSSSNLYKQFIEHQLKSDEMTELQTECGFDPLSEVKEVIIGAVTDDQMQPQEDKSLFVVKGLARTKLTECAKKMAAKEDKKMEITEDGKFTKLTDGNDTMWLAWLDDTTVVVSPKMDKAALEARLASKDSVSSNKDMMTILGSADQKAGIWFAMKKPAGAKAPGDVDFTAAFGSINLSGGLKVTAGIRQASGEEANKTVTMAKEGIGQMKPMLGPMAKYVDKLEISAKDTDVLLNLSLSDADVADIVKQAGPMMGAMMGGGF